MTQSEKTLAKKVLKQNPKKILTDDDLSLAEKQIARIIENVNIMEIKFDDVITILEEIAKLKDGTLELKFQNYQLTKINGHWKSYPRKTK